MRVSAVLFAQGGYYAATGIAPFVSRKGFEAVTGPKRDWWLVQTVGAVVTAVGAGLMAAGARRQAPPEVVGIAAGCAAGLGALDVYHATGGRVANIYLLDAACQYATLVALARALISAEPGATKTR